MFLCKFLDNVNCFKVTKSIELIQTYLSFELHIHLEFLTRDETSHCIKWSKLPARLLVGSKWDKTPKPSILIIHMIPLPCQEHQWFLPTQCVFLKFYSLEKKQDTWWNVYVVLFCISTQKTSELSLDIHLANPLKWICDKFNIFEIF